MARIITATIASLVLLAALVLVIELPDPVPIHIASDGTADGFASPAAARPLSIALPAVVALLLAAISWTRRRPPAGMRWALRLRVGAVWGVGGIMLATPVGPDQSTFFHGDEGDEASGRVSNTTTRVWNMDDLDAPVLAETFANDTTSIDHNMYTEGDLMYQSNYTTGLRIMDIADAVDDGPEEVAYFDVYPGNDNPSFEGGTWSNYPYFRQKHVVAVSSIDRGLSILRPSPRLASHRNG